MRCIAYDVRRLSAERRGALGTSRCCMSMRTPSSFIQPALGSG